MPDYKNAKIYKIVSNITNDVYIGSTCSPLSQRLSEHRRKYTQYLNGKFHYMTSFKVLETNDYCIVLIEDYPCERKENLHARERSFIQGCNNCVNTIIPMRTRKEYYEQNKQRCAEQRKEYYELNKAEVLDKQKGYYEQNKERISQQRKIYQEQNKDKISTQMKKYFQQNKKILSEKHNAKYICGCGVESTIGNKTRHEKTKKHQAFIQQQE